MVKTFEIFGVKELWLFGYIYIYVYIYTYIYIYRLDVYTIYMLNHISYDCVWAYKTDIYWDVWWWRMPFAYLDNWSIQWIRFKYVHSNHNNFITWPYFPHYIPFLWRIYQWIIPGDNKLITHMQDRWVWFVYFGWIYCFNNMQIDYCVMASQFKLSKTK